MEGRGPYRIYDPGGSTEASATYERLVEENSRLKEQLQGMKMLGQLLGESQMEASRLRQKAEALVGDSPPLPQVTEPEGKDTSVPTCLSDPTKPGETPPPPPSSVSSEFELVGSEQQSPTGRTAQSPQEPGAPAGENLLLHLQRLESALSICAQEPDHSQLFTHLGRMALEFNRLAAKVHSNERRTSVLQTLCEQLRQENQVLKAKLDQGLEQRGRVAEQLREENKELRQLLLGRDTEGGKAVRGPQQAAEPAAKPPEVGAAEKKVKMLEQQRLELLDVNKQWDQHFRSLKQQCEQKITELRQKLADALRQVAALEAEREEKQRDFDRKLLLAKSKIELEETDKEQRAAEAQELRREVQALQSQLGPLARQRDHQEREIQRLNKALEEALSLQASPPTPGAAFGDLEAASSRLRKQELITQNELLKQQVKIFEEDFQKERSDRERMNEEKEELKRQLQQLQAQMAAASTQALQEGEKEREAHRQKRMVKVPSECCPEHLCGACPYAYPPMPARGFEDWTHVRYPPAPLPVEQSPPLPSACVFHMPEHPWRQSCARPHHHQSPQAPASPTARPADPE